MRRIGLRRGGASLAEATAAAVAAAAAGAVEVPDMVMESDTRLSGQEDARRK